ncbi:5-oxoprolinase subunit PxpA [Flavobacteriaceae bacterium MHTCC 0001]
MHKFSIDINADVGEGINNESQLLPLISSCNIACGAHAGTMEIMQDVVKLAKIHGVKIGAHPSFPDPENFGRTPMQMSRSALYKSIEDQVVLLLDILKTEGLTLHHVKPHGALYNLAVTDAQIAKIVVDVLKQLSAPTLLYVPYKSVIAKIALKQDIPIIYEVFADRQYNDDLTLVSRKEPNAVFHDTNQVYEHVYRMVSEGKVKTISGKLVPIKAQTVCVHGDNPKAINLANLLKTKLEEVGISIE